jgi:predicted transcriptional regulator
MQLAEWMQRKNLGDQAMADLIGDVDRSMVSRYRRRTHRPSWSVVLRIIEITGGEVTADDFLTVEAAE